jgi:hypothetical protein
VSGFDPRILKDGLLIRTTDGRNVTLAEQVTFTRPAEVGGQTIVVPAGTTSDGASIPQAAWSAGFAPFGPWWLACVCHDWLYRNTRRPREECDLILWEGMEALGVPITHAKIIYNAVREFGRAAFDADRAAQGAKA